MREYLFRGKRKDNGEWAEGGSIFRLINKIGEHFFIPQFGEGLIATHDDNMMNIVALENMTMYRVDPETVGQYTGHICKNGKLFEGDLIKYKNSPINLIRWNQDISGFEAVTFRDGVEYTCGICMVEDVEIIGNIHDNPEILKEGGKNDEP